MAVNTGSETLPELVEHIFLLPAEFADLGDIFGREMRRRFFAQLLHIVGDENGPVDGKKRGNVGF